MKGEIACKRALGDTPKDESTLETSTSSSYGDDYDGVNWIRKRTRRSFDSDISLTCGAGDSASESTAHWNRSSAMLPNITILKFERGK
jgi:hypothetical protein